MSSKTPKVSKNRLSNYPNWTVLGLHIDEFLSWDKHIDYLCSVISSRKSLLKHLSYYAPQNVQKGIIKATFSLR